ncbi:TPA: hypothetical protein ACH3X1_012180 [Trebouxia sp. C0004]
MFQQPKWSAGVSSNRLGPPAWQASHLQAGNVTVSSSGVSTAVQHADEPAGEAGPACQLSLEACLDGSWPAQLKPQSVIDSRQLVEGRPASTDASPSMSHAQTAAHPAEADHVMETAAPLLNAAAPATQQPAQMQHAEHAPGLFDTGKTQAAARTISHDIHPDHQISHQLNSSGKGQQQQPQSMPGATHHTGTDGADASEGGVQLEQEAAGAAKGATLSQESSSMMSLSPSLKLDIPGLDDMLDSHMLSEHEDQAMLLPLLQPSLLQQQHNDEQHGHQQQPVEGHQQQQQKGDSPFMDGMPASAAETQAASMLSAEPSSPPASQSSPRYVPSVGLPHSEQQAAEEAVSHCLISSVPQQCTSPHHHAKPSLDESGTRGVRAAGALSLSAAAADSSGHDVPTASQGPQAPNTGCASKLAVDDRSPAGPADSALSQEHQVESSDTGQALQPGHDSLQSKPGSSPPQETRPSAISSAKSAETVAPDSAVLTDGKPGANHSSSAMPEASTHAKEPGPTGSAAQGTAMQQAHGAVPAPSQTADAAAVEQLPDALTVPMQQDEAVDVSQQVGEPGEGVAANQEGLHTSQHTSVTASKKAVQQKRQQPSSSTATGPPSRRRCVVTRSSGGGQVQPLLTAPTDVTFQDKKGLYETSRSGRVRYPPLAFWMRETKVHDKLGGAFAIERPGGSCTPPTHPKPPQPAAPALTRTQSRSLATQSQMKAVTGHTHSSAQPKAKSQAKPRGESASSVEDPQAEVPSGTQAEVSHPGGTDGRPPLGKARQQLPVQHSRRHTTSSAQPAVTVPPQDPPSPPQDPPSPPFPYPILAGKSPRYTGASSEQQTGQMANQSSQAQPQKQTAARQACNASKSGDISTGVATDAVHIRTSKLAAARPAVTGATAQLKRCGTCKTCMRPQSKQGCLVNKALREQAVAMATAPATAPVPAEQGRAAQGSTPAAASKPEKASQVGPNSKAKSHPSGAADKAVQQRKAEPAGKSGTASKAPADTQPHKAGVSSKPVRQPKTRKAAGADQAGNVSSGPQGSIHSALTQAVDLASDMEQPHADQEQQEAAQVLESLKNSPTAPSRSRSAASQPSAAIPAPLDTALGLSEGVLRAGPDQAIQSEQTAAASPTLPSAKQERRGRPRKKPVFDAEDEKKPSGPKRPRETPLAEPVEDPLTESNELPPEASCQQEQMPAASSVPSGSALPQPREADRAVALQPLTSTAPSTKVKVEKVDTKVRQRKGSQPADAASTLEASGQPSINARSPAAAGWTADQKAALQKAYLTVKPSQRNFWQHVAKLVPDRTALECCNCKFDELPTPVEKVKQTARSAAAKDSSRIRPPALKVAGGRIKKPSAAATKQWARQVRWQQRAQEQSDDDSPQPVAQTTSLHRQRSNLGSSQRASATSTLLAAIHKQDKADKYIDRILRKQGGRLHKLKAAPVASASLQASKASHRGSQHATNGVMAELQALGRQQPENEDMYDSEQDHYFSEEDS